MSGDLPDLNVKSLRKALKAWSDTAALGAHPLAGWEIVEAQRRAQGYEETAAGRGLALRALLRKAIESLAPERGNPAFEDRRWRPHLILKQRYIDDFSPDYIAGQLAIARSTYNHEQLRAEKALLARLLEWSERASPASATEAPDQEFPYARAPAPFMAPQQPPKGLIGRSKLFGELRSMLTGGTPEQKLALHGLPGVGKTALAIELAHDPEVRKAYPDGVLWVGLGQSPDLPVLLNLLAAGLGLHLKTFASLETFEDRARVLHATIGSKRMLLVLDDVWQATHALALQLAGPECATVITTRAPGLIHALAGFESFEVPELSVENSLHLLRQFAPSVVQVREDLLADAIQQIGGLPLALVLVGGFLRREAYSGQSRRLTEALGRLREIRNWGEMSGSVSPLDQRPGLGMEESLSLFGIIAMSEAILQSSARQMLLTLAAFPPKPATFHESLILSASGGGTGDLDALVDAGLVEAAGGERCRVHGAIVQYAAANARDPEMPGRTVRAVLDYLEGPVSDPLDYSADVPMIRGVLKIAQWEGMLPDWAEIAHHYFEYLARMGLFGEAIEMMLPVLDQIETEGAFDERFILQRDLGFAYQRAGEYAKAARRYEQAHELAMSASRPEAICAALQGLGAVAYSQGELEQAGEYYLQGLANAEQAGLIVRQAGLHSNLGGLAMSRGDLEAAVSHFEHGLALARESGDRGLAGALLSNLGTTRARMGDFDSAEEVFKEGLAFAEQHSDRGAQVALLTNLGTLAHEQGESDRAARYFEDALDLAREIDDPAGVCQLLANLGALATAGGELERSETLLKEGLAIAEGIGHREHQILLRINLAERYRIGEEAEAAEQQLEEARSLADEIQHTRYQQIIEERFEGDSV